MNLLEELKSEYDLCINNPSEYQRKVDSISDLFFLKGKRRLKWNYCPVRVFGKYPSAPFVMFGINPGIFQKDSPLEDAEARKSWRHYQNLYLNFYGTFYHFWIKSPYYSAMSHLVAGLSDDHQNKSRWELFDSYLTNLELIPYHSEGIVHVFIYS